jgi:hypothetical protein
MNLRTDPDACWADPVDLEGQGVSSEIIEDLGVESEVANDFILDES